MQKQTTTPTYKYATSLVTDAEIIKQLRDGTIPTPPKLLEQIINFDHTYHFSDSMSVYNARSREEAEIRDAVASIDTDDDTKKLFLSGLIDPTELNNKFPEIKLSRYINREPKGMLGLLVSGITDQDIEQAKKPLKVLVSATNMLANRDIARGCVYTKATDDDVREIDNKLNIPSGIQQMIFDFESSVSHKSLQIMCGLEDTLELFMDGKYYIVDVLHHTRLGYDYGSSPWYTFTVYTCQTAVCSLTMCLKPNR